MKIIFATTNNRKLEDLKNVIKEENFDLEVVSLSDIGWDEGEIEEDGLTIEENSFIKAIAVKKFCEKHNINYPIVTDDAGLFVNSLGGEPGIYTARYADEELAYNPNLPKYFALFKMLDKLQGKDNRSAEYRCAITVMFDDGKVDQFLGRTEGYIDDKINEPIKKPYFYSLFVDLKTGKPFNTLDTKELKNTYRFNALREALYYWKNKLNKDNQMS